MRKYLVLSVVMAGILVLPIAAQQGNKDAVDLSTVALLKHEAINNSQVMRTLSFISDVYGPRLTGSPNTKMAADWVEKSMNEWGLSNVHLETWDFGKGWVNERFYANVTAPTSYPLIAYPLAWTPGTNGPVTAEVKIVNAANDEDIEKLRGTLKGKIVMLDPPREIPMSTEPLAHRYTDERAEGTQRTRLPGTRTRRCARKSVCESYSRGTSRSIRRAN